MKCKSKVERRPDDEIYKDLQKITVQGIARAENALNFMITIDQEQEFYQRLKHQMQPSGVQ